MLNPGPKVVFELLGLPITDTLITSWFVSLVILIAGILIGRNLKLVPGRTQMVMELFFTGFEGLIDGIMPGEGRKYMPMVGTILLFIGLSNLSGFIPFVNSPTSDINTTVAYAGLVFLVTHAVAIREKGIGGYLKSFAEPSIIMLPMNIIGEISKPVSHAFRLFGNMVGGGILIAIVVMLIPGWIFPFHIALNAWFNLAQGLIQAFIFAMLTVVYISVQKS